MFLFLLAAQPEPKVVDGVSKNWVGKPDVAQLERCSQRLRQNGGPAWVRVVMQCTSAADDRLENCKVIESTAPGNADVDAAAICASAEFRIRTTDASGQVVTGVTVKVPFQIQM